MTGARFTPNPVEPPPDIVVEPELRTGAGSPATLRVTVTNRAAEARIIAVTLLGLDAAWLPRPSRSPAIAPGESIAAELTLAPAHGSVPARYPFAIAVEALDPVTGAAAASTAIADVVLVVDEPSQIAIELDPPAATAVFGRKLTVNLHNRGSAPAAVRLETGLPANTQLRLGSPDLMLAPGQHLAVRGRLRVRRPKLLGQRSRHTYTVTARSAGAPRHTEGALTVRPLLGSTGTKAFAMIAVVAVWVALALVFIPKLSNHVKTDQKIAAPAQTSTVPAPNGTDGTGAPGSGTPGTGSSGSGSGTPGTSTAAATTVQLNGTVTGAAPSGVQVAISPTSLVNENAQGATSVGVSPADYSAARIGKTPQSALLLTPPRTVSRDSSLTTGADGAWAFPGVQMPGYYLLTFSKPGFQTQRYIVDSSTAIATQPLKVLLLPGQGSLQGTVTGPGGPVGAAQITITDGTNTITASSNSKGQIGSWSVTGLSTPASYLVTATKNGMSTESQLIELGAGGSSTVGLKLKAGVATLGGVVTGPNSSGALTGLGNVQVTVTDGTTARTATTVTTGSLTGHYTLPDLAPGLYTITVQATGYLTQTRQVRIAKGTSSATVNATLNSSAAIVTGNVQGTQFDASTGAPLTSGGEPVIGPIIGAGLTLANSDNTYKITSSGDGSYRFNGVAPGTYVLSAQYAGLATAYQTVTAVVGNSNQPVSFTLKAEMTVNTSTITGYVGSATTSGGTLGCPTPLAGVPPLTCTIFFTLTDSERQPVLTQLPGGTTYQATSTITPATNGPTPYTLSTQNGLAPGLYHLTIGSTGYLPATITVRVPLNSVATAPQVSLYPANVISGTITALTDARSGTTVGLDGTAYTNCVWAIPEGFSDPTGAITQPPTSCPTGAAAPSLDGCSSFGHASPGLSVIAADSTYSIGGLCDGTYKVYVFMQNPAYVSPVLAALQTVSHGQTLDYSPHVQRKPRVVLNFRKIDPATGIATTAPAGMRLNSVSCTPATPPAVTAATAGVITTDSTGRLIVSGIDAGSGASCVVSGTDPSTSNAMNGTVSNLNLANDSDTAATITLTQGLGTVYGQVVSPYAGQNANGVGGASVTVTGTVGFDGTDAQQNTPATVVTSAQGCFAIVHDGDPNALVIHPPAQCGTDRLPASAITVVPLVSPSVSVNVAATTGTKALQSQVNFSPTSLTTLSVSPLPASTSGLTLVATDPANVNLSAAGITVTAKPTGAGNVTVSANSTGGLIWNDSSVGTLNQAWPGVYTVAATLPGYTPATATIDCPFQTAAAPPCSITTAGGFALVALGALSGTVYGKDGGTGATPVLAGATVTLTCVSGSLAPCATAGSTISATTDSSGRYIFAGTATHFFMARTQWSLSVSATGYVDGAASTTITNGENSQDITLNALGILSGTISGNDPGRTVKQQPLPGATVTLTCVSGSRPPCGPGTTSISTVTNASGNYSFAGAPVAYFMATGVPWTLVVTATGYVDKTDRPQISSGTNSADLTLDALGMVSGYISGLTADSADSVQLVGATVQISCIAGSQAPCGAPGSTVSTVTDGYGHYSFTGIASTYFMAASNQWTFKVIADGYSTNTFAAQTIVSGTNELPLQLNALGSLSGTVTGWDAAPLLAQVSATCANPDPTSPACPTAAIVTTTDRSGHYSLTGSDTNYSLPLADWTLSVTAAGYLPATATRTVVSGGNTQDVPMTARGSLTGTITAQNGDPVSGAVVTATCTTGTAGSPVVACGQSEVRTGRTDLSGHYSIADPVSSYVMTPGAWTVTVTATGYPPQPLVDSTPAGATTLTINPGPNTADGTLVPLGTLSGTISGLMAKPGGANQANFTQQLSSAKVIIKACPGDSSTCPTTNLTPGATGTTTVSSDTNGNYTFAPSATPFLTPGGGYQVTVTAFGYLTKTTAITATSGTNALPVTLAVRPVDLPIGILVSGSTSTYTAHVKINLVRTDDPTTNITLTMSNANPNKIFHTPGPDYLIPATYRVTVSGDNSSLGSSILPTVASITVPLSDIGTTDQADIPVTIVQNTVTGTVTGLSGKSGTAKLAGVQAELGTLDEGGVFTASVAANGNDLVVTSAPTTGAILFTGIPNGTYVARINYLSPINGYGAVTTASVTVGYGQTAPLPAISLPRVTRAVTVQVTTSDPTNLLSGVGVSVTSASDSTWSFAAPTPTHTAGSKVWTWSVGQVPFGDWTLKIPLPAGHYGAVTPSNTSGGPAMTCGTTSPITCTSGTVAVSGDASSSSAVALNYDLDEYQPSVAVTAAALALDTAPTTVTVKVGSFYTDPSFPVSTGAVPTPALLPVWVQGGQRITASVGTPGWIDQSFAATAAAPSATIALTEVGAVVTVKLATSPAFPGNATISLVPPAGSLGISAPATLSAGQGGSVSFSGIPYAVGWKAHATVTYTVPAVPADGSTPEVPAYDVTLTGDSAAFTVNAQTIGPITITMTQAP